MRTLLVLVALALAASATMEGAWRCSLAQKGEVSEDSLCFSKSMDFDISVFRGHAGAWVEGSEVLGSVVLEYKYNDEESSPFGWYGKAFITGLAASTNYKLVTGTKGTCLGESVVATMRTDSTGVVDGDFVHSFGIDAGETFDFNVLRIFEEGASRGDDCETSVSSYVEPSYSSFVMEVAAEDDEIYASPDNFRTDRDPYRSEDACPFIEQPLRARIAYNNIFVNEYDDGEILEGTNCIQTATPSNSGYALWKYWARGQWRDGSEVDSLFMKDNWGPNIDKTMGDSLFYTASSSEGVCAIRHRLTSTEDILRFNKKTFANNNRAVIRLTVAQGNGGYCDIDLVVRGVRNPRASPVNAAAQPAQVAKPSSAGRVGLAFLSVGAIGCVVFLALFFYRRNASASDEEISLLH